MLRLVVLLPMMVSLQLIGPETVTADDSLFVPFVIPDKVNDKSLIAMAALPEIKPDGPRLTCQDGHFYVGKERYRAWGVNFCFGANFPTHDDAEQIARRLGQFGVNAVRMHHMDMMTFPGGIWDPKDRQKLSTEALDRLDYFIDQLARHGIRVNINLHVSRSHAKALKLPEADKAPDMDKIVAIYMPELIEAQKSYARMLLDHVNPYRKARYGDDAAISWLEITNENSFFMWGSTQTIRDLPGHYAKALQEQYVAYLEKRYGTTAKLRQAWSKGSMELGRNMLDDASFRLPKVESGGWNLSCLESAAAKARPLDPSGLRVDIEKVSATNWHIQLMQGQLTLKKGQLYTLSFRAKADEPRQISVSVGQHQTPWKNLGLAATLKLDKQWKDFRFGFVADADDKNARVAFILGDVTAAVEVDVPLVATGGIDGLAKEESLEKGNIALFGVSETQARQVERMRFFAEIEKAYFDGMRKFLREELKCSAAVTGTIAFGPLGLYAQSDMDYIDAHAYWQHPSFPGKPWDSENWRVEQKSMVAQKDKSPLFQLAPQRLEGKPYTVSEYNHSAPNDYQVECVPMIASFAAAQDWDAVWLFAYAHGAGKEEHFTNFFDIRWNPAKWGFMPAGAVIFRNSGVKPLTGRAVIALSDKKDFLDDLSVMHNSHGLAFRSAIAGLKTKVKLDADFMLANQVRLRLTGSHALPGASGSAGARTPETHYQRWDGNYYNMAGEVATSAARVCVGEGLSTDDWGTASSKIDKPDFGAMVQVSLDGRPLRESKKILLIAAGRCESTDMKFSPDRKSVGRNWGKSPVLVEALEGFTVCWGGSAKWRCQAINPDGTAGQDVPFAANKFEPTIRVVNLSPRYKTMWYLFTRD